MKVMVIGGGGREAAICKKLRQSPRVTELFALPGNGGIADYATCVPIGVKEIEKQVAFALNEKIDYAVVAPDDPLALGAVDRLTEAGIPCFGPDQKAAQIEASKAFSKRLMQKYKIPTAKCEIFDDFQKALSYLETCPLPVVVKASGLALGKGVVIASTRAEAQNAVRAMMEEKVFGESGNCVVLEEFLTGPEVSVLCFTDGKTIVPMVSSMDHKRAHDGDTGPNTGGMGTIAPNPFYTDKIAKTCMDTIFLPTIRAMASEGRPFQGCLYFGLMLTPDGPKVIEYNCRFGDPETQVVLPLLQSDLFEVMLACTEGRLGQMRVEFSRSCACCVIAASGGYPARYEKHKAITLSENARAHADFAGVERTPDGTLYTSGGRVLGITATAPTLQEAIGQAYALCREVQFEGLFYRRDIGARALAGLEE